MSRQDAFAKAGRDAVQQNIQGTLEFFRQYPPFDAMEPAELGFLVENCVLRFYAQGENVISPEDGPVNYLYIIKQGRVYGERRKGQDVSDETIFELAVGECFPIAALLGERATRTVHTADEDCFCFLLTKDAFVKLMQRSETFRDFCVRGISSLLDQVNVQVQNRAAESLGSQISMDMPLSQMSSMREPVTCPASTPLHEAVQLMHETQVGSIMIANELMQPQGIFTLRDLRRVIADPNTDLRQPMQQVMTPNPFYLSPDATAFDAALAMTERHIAHVCLVRDGRLVGMVSERDLFSLRRVDLVSLARTVRTAPSLEKLVLMRKDVQSMVERMIAHGASPEQITRLITLLNDHTTSRIIELVLDKHGNPGIPFSWMVFGSEGRKEQTLFTDQDNGILFEAANSEEANAIRQKLLPIAREINVALDDCGFTLCRGNFMAGNAEFCLSRQEWLARYQRMMRDATAQNMQFAGVHFDLRCIWGPEQPCTDLHRQIVGMVAADSVFQRVLAESALLNKPPLGGLFRNFTLSKKGAEKDSLDLKVKGLAPFVESIRVLALSQGIEASNTLERIRQLVGRGIIERLDGDAYAEAYHFVQLIRMQHHQLQQGKGLSYSNLIYPDELNTLDRRILRESFRQAQRIQSSLALRYQL